MDTSNMTRRERKKQETKANILKAARHLFEDKGFEYTSLEEITERADISKGTFFNYFTSKDNLLVGIAEEEIEDVLFYAEEEISNIPCSTDKIRLIVRRLLEDAIPYLHLTGRIMFTSIINTEGSESPFVKINTLLDSIVEEGQKAGELTDSYSAADITTSILGCYYGVIFKWFELGGTSGTTAELDRALDMLFQGIGRR